MTNLTSPVASATSGFQQNYMADVIDSLKRLERLGDENSKTVQKILDAARDIEARIVRLFDQYPSGVKIECKGAFEPARPDDLRFVMSPNDATKAAYQAARKEFETSAEAAGISPTLYDVSYIIETRHGVRCLVRDGGDDRVSENRNAALTFADDIAKGLLIVIAKHLESQKGANENALSVLSKAKEALRRQGD